jgi:putative ABC transport system substrate-binding protein
MLPIVMVLAFQPVESGFAASLARPGGNITGLTLHITPETVGKRLQLLKEVTPGLSRVAVLRYPRGRAAAEGDPYWKAAEDAARILGVTVQAVDVRAPSDFEGAFAAIARRRADGLYVWLHAMTFTHRGRIVDFAARNRLPAVYESREFSDAGGLMAYGVDNHDLYRRAAVYVDKILKGAKPGDLPVEQPTKFELVINLKTAKALGLTIPPSLLGRADEVIQ